MRSITFVLAAVLTLSAGCNNDSTTTTSGIDLTAFKAMAASADCDDIRNRLFLIDERMVFWDREGSCADGHYALVLFAETIDTYFCERHESIGGPNETQCPVESYRALFETMVHNLDDPQLGLGPGHTVEPIPF
jgi:hypothetical protein